MNRAIEVTGDREEEITRQLKDECRAIEWKAHKEFRLTRPLYSAILFAPGLPGRALGIFMEETGAIVLSDRLADRDIPFSYVKNIFLHELAHALERAAFGECSGHGARFHSCCAFLGVEEGFDMARISERIEQRDHKKDKIRKLLALSSSPFREEAATAVEMAQRLMAENPEDGMGESTDSSRIYFAVLEEAGRISSGASYLLNLTEKATGVFLVRSHEGTGSAVRAYGSLEEIELAIYLYGYLNSAIDSEIRRLRKEGQRITRTDFIYGACSGLMEKISSTASADSRAVMQLNRKNRELAEKLVFRNAKLRTERRSSHLSDRKSMQLGGSFASGLDMPKRIQQKKLKGKQ